MGLETPRMPSPEEAAKIEAGRERTEAEAKKEADLRNDGLSRQRNPSEKSKETARSVLYGNARAENQARDYEKIMGMELQHDYPGSIEKMEKVTKLYKTIVNIQSLIVLMLALLFLWFIFNIIHAMFHIDNSKRNSFLWLSNKIRGVKNEENKGRKNG